MICRRQFRTEGPPRQLARVRIIPAEQRIAVKAGKLNRAVVMVCHRLVITNKGAAEQRACKLNPSGSIAASHDMMTAMTTPIRHHRRKRSTRLRPLSSLADKLVGPGLQKRSRFLAKLIADWPVIAGDAAGYCLPVDLQFQKNKQIDGTLVISVVSGRGPQLQMMSRDLITQVNRSLGFAAISRIRLRQDLVRPAARRDQTYAEEASGGPPGQTAQAKFGLHQLETATSRIQSPELRAALIRLGQQIK